MVSEKWCNKHWKIIKTVSQNGANNHQKNIQKSMWKKIDFRIDFRFCFEMLGAVFLLVLPSVRKVNNRKTTKRKEKRKKRNSAGQEAVLFNSNTPLGRQAGPGRISVACGNYPPRACKDRWMRKSEAVQRKSAFRKGVPSISLQVLCGSGCVKSWKFREKHRKDFFPFDFHWKYRKGTNNDARRRPKWEI